MSKPPATEGHQFVASVDQRIVLAGVSDVPTATQRPALYATAFPWPLGNPMVCVHVWP